MEKPIVKEINDIEIEKYQRHPRILELRIVLVFTNLANAYNYNTAMDFFQALCKIFQCNWQLLSGILNNVYNIRSLEKKDKLRFRQEAIFMGILFNETRYSIVKNYLDLSLPSIYKKELNYENYVTQDWLDKLDANIAICGVPAYKLEATRFVEGMEGFLEVVGRVSLPKIKIRDK